MPRGDKWSVIAAAAIFIILEVAAFGLISRTSTLQNIWLNRFSHRVMASTWGLGEKVHHYFSLSEENEELAKANFELSRQLDYYRSLYPEEIARAVEAPSGTGFTYVPATIVKISRNTQHNYIILNKGSEDGVVPHSGIITGDGVVGIIDAVDEHYSYGLTLMNDKVSVSARIGSDGVIASLVWDGIHTDGALLKNIPLHVEVGPGDTICTSGISEVFPGDLALGVVEDTYSVSGVVNEAAVRLFQDFSSLRYVTIVSNPVKDEIAALEAKEETL